MVEYSWSQQMLKIERKDKILFLHDNYTFSVLFMMDISIVYSLEKLHPRLYPDDDTLNMYLVGILKVPTIPIVFMLNN